MTPTWNSERLMVGPDGVTEVGFYEFLRLLEVDILTNPQRLTGIPPELYERLIAVTAGMEANPYDPIEGPVAL